MRVCVLLCGHVSDALSEVMPPLLDCFEALLGPRLPEARFTATAAMAIVSRFVFLCCSIYHCRCLLLLLSVSNHRISM